MINNIDHIGIVVRSVEASLNFYTEILGLELQEIEVNEAFGVKIAFLPVGDTLVELIEPIKEGTMGSKFLKEKGEGLHHIAFEVNDIEAFLNKLKKADVSLLHDTPQPGGQGSLVAFIDPSAANSVYIELIQKPLFE